MNNSNQYASVAERQTSNDLPVVSGIPMGRTANTPYSQYSILDRDAGLGEMFNIVYRGKWLILGVMLASVLLAGTVLQLLTPRYSAETLMLIEPRQTTIATLDSVLQGVAADDQDVRSQVEVLQSRGLAASVIHRLELDQDPEFNSRLRPPGVMARYIPFLRPEQARIDARNDAGLVDALLSRLSVEAVKDSRVISVVFSSVSAEKAALIANTLADEYLLSQLETKFEATRMANSWLNERVSELREQVAESEKAVEDFRRSAELLQTQGVTLTAQQIAELNGQLILVRAATAEAEARLQQVTNLIDSPDGISTASEVLDSPLVQNLKEQQAQVERRVAELSAEYGPSHPKMIQLKAEQEDLSANIESEVNRIAQSLRNEVAIAGARQASLERELTQLKEIMAQSNDKQIQLRALEREAEANRGLLATLLARYKETNSQDEMQTHQADARIISRADAPVDPSFPKKTFAFGIVIPLSGLLALLAVFVFDTLQRGFVSGDQIEAVTGVASLGFIPLLGRKGLQKANPDLHVLKRPRSALCQSLRTAYWSLSLITPFEPRNIVITSSLPNEGKTTVALGIARTQALAGRKTLLIDADTRNPVAHSALYASREPGLTDVLRGTASSNVIVKDWATGLDFLAAGVQIEDPLPLLDSKEMDELLSQMMQKYELIVIDTPPVMAASDACALSRKADTTIMVVRWSETRREVVTHTLKQLARAGGHLAGALLNMVDVGKHSMYPYGDSGAYHGTLRKYYNES